MPFCAAVSAHSTKLVCGGKALDEFAKCGVLVSCCAAVARMVPLSHVRSVPPKAGCGFLIGHSSICAASIQKIVCQSATKVIVDFVTCAPTDFIQLVCPGLSSVSESEHAKSSNGNKDRPTLTWISRQFVCIIFQKLYIFYFRALRSRAVAAGCLVALPSLKADSRYPTVLRIVRTGSL
jgi:hypothetical protein